MRIYDTKVNHMTNPIGFAMEEAVFSWKVAGSAGSSQAAARVKIYADQERQNVLADTGWEDSLDSLGTRVEVPLFPRTRYYWDVQVKSNAGEEAGSDVQWFETGKRGEAWEASWITCDANELRHPYFEKEISPRAAVAKARLYICGLGLYEGFYNGERIGDEYLTPYCTDYNQWIQYQTYDITKLLAGKGVLSVLLGNGWYKGRFGFASREEKGYYGNEWKLIAELRIEYEDGSEEVIGTDDSWQVRRSNITYSSLYDGEHRDDTLPALAPQKASICEAPKGTLSERLSLPVRIRKVMEPAELITTPAGEQVFDMGQEFTGLFSLRVQEAAGTLIHIQTGEILQQGNFYNANLRTAKSEYYYTCDGSEVTLIPHFTFYGYRYVKIEGVSALKKEDFQGLVLYSEIEDKGDVETGHALVNKLISNVRWGLRSNFVDVPTDCPQRDERMGWTGDANVFAPTALYLTDSYAFYRKYLYDLYQEQKEHDGMVPDVIPSFGVESTACVWGDVACFLPWNLYVYYGDKTILEKQYDSMKAWVEYVRRVDGDDHGWRRVFHYGDWLALDHPAGGDEQVLGATDEEFIANIYYAASAQLVSKAAGILGYKEDEKAYKELSDEQFAAVRYEYFSATGRCCIKTQTALLLTLKYGLSDNPELIKKQLKKLFEDSNGKLKTGFVGTPILCNVLSDNGFEDLSWKLLLNEEFPGWLREIKLGATTVWERWNSLLDDGTISGISMNSMNHYAYGSVLEWIFRHAAGLNVSEEAVGSRHMVIAPEVNPSVSFVRASYDSPSGLWKAGWEVLDKMHLKVQVTVPFGASATVKLPYSDEVKELSSGEYVFTYETNRALGKSFSTRTPLREIMGDAKAKEVLARMVPLQQVPEVFWDRSIRDIAERYGGMTDEQLGQVDRILANI